jgi:sugar/nucleoside kinase (ribokinase family)
LAEVLVAGHICLDIIPKFEQFSQFTPGSLVEVGAATLALGGCVANVGQALHRLGTQVRLKGKIGDDPFGKIVIDLLERESPSLTDQIIVSPKGLTSYSVVISPPGIDRTFLHMPGENHTFGKEDLGISAYQGVKHFHFGYPPLMARMYLDDGSELTNIFLRAKQAGLSTSLDMSLPDVNSPSGQVDWEKILRNVLPCVDFFMPSQDELGFMLGHDCLERLMSESIRFGAGVVIVKRGDLGLAALANSESRLNEIPNLSAPSSWHTMFVTQPCLRVEVKGTTGAGDATIAGFLKGFLCGFGLIECLQAGCAVGAFCVEATDALSGIRTWSETLDRIEVDLTHETK